MVKSEAAQSLKIWNTLDARVYRYSMSLRPAEFVTFRKTDMDLSDPENPRCNFICDPSRSTYDLGTIEYDKFLRMVSNEILTYHKDHSYNTDVHSIKTGGCECGAWILKDSVYLHHKDCPKYRNPFDGSMPDEAK